MVRRILVPVVRLKSKRVIAGLIFILVIGWLGCRTVCSQTVLEDLPVEHREKYNKINRWLDQKLVEWKPSRYNNISFCAHHLLISEQMVNFTPPGSDLLFLEMLQETGIDCVRLSIFPYNYEKYSLRYDFLIGKIKEKKLKLMVAYMVGNLPQGDVLSFEEYKKKELDFTLEFVKKHNPDYYAVVTEPITMEKRIKLPRRLSDEEWVRLVRETVNLVKKIDPRIKTIAALNTEAGQLDLARKFSRVGNLDIVAFQLYGPAGMYKEYKGWVGTGDVVTEAINYVQAQAKDVWLTETWLSIPTAETWNGTKSSNSYFNASFMAELDAKWLKLVTYYAQNNNIKGISPFFTGKFISYPESNPEEQKQNFIRNFYSGHRTKPFCAYQDIIREVNRGIPDSNTAGSFVSKGNSGNVAKKLSKIKIASLYDNITDGVKYGRSLEETVQLLQETNTDFVFRGFFKWIWPIMESPDEIPLELIKASGASEQAVKTFSENLKGQGYYYGNLRKYISAIKVNNPDLIFCTAVPAQCIGKLEINPLTGKLYSTEDSWAMAFDPGKWKIEAGGKLVTKEQFQKWFYGVHPYGGTDAKEYDWHKAEAFFPDITNGAYQELLVSLVKKQIDCGADAIWIDGLPQEPIFYSIFKNSGRNMLKDMSAAAAKIVDAIHEYGITKGKYIYVGYWANPLGLLGGFAYTPAKVDFVTIAPSQEEVLAKKIDEVKWIAEAGNIRKIYGDIPIFAFIDWAFDDSQVVAFSQKLNKEEQSQVLEVFDKAFENMGVKFVYPLHGGYMGSGAVTTKLSFGKDRIYDSLAPEFDSYKTIKKLAQEKARLQKTGE